MIAMCINDYIPTDESNVILIAYPSNNPQQAVITVCDSFSATAKTNSFGDYETNQLIQAGLVPPSYAACRKVESIYAISADGVELLSSVNPSRLMNVHNELSVAVALDAATKRTLDQRKEELSNLEFDISERKALLKFLQSQVQDANQKLHHIRSKIRETIHNINISLEEEDE